jgi:hypothetical protein
MVRRRWMDLRFGVLSVYASGMQFTLYWPDSEVHELSHLPDQDGLLRVRLSAAWVRHDDAAQGPQWGFMPGLDVVFEGATVSGDLADGVGGIAQGQWCVEGSDMSTRLDHMVLPWSTPPYAEQSIKVELALRNGCTLLIRAKRGQCLLPPGARMVESYAC